MIKAGVIFRSSRACQGEAWAWSMKGYNTYPGQHLEGVIEGCAGDVGGRPGIHNVIPPTCSQLLQAQHIAALMHGANVVRRGLLEVRHVHQLLAQMLLSVQASSPH